MGSTEIAPSLGRAVIQCSIRKENPRSRHSRVIDVQIAMAQRVLEVTDRAGEQMRERLFVGLDGVRVGQRAGGAERFSHEWYTEIRIRVLSECADGRLDLLERNEHRLI